MKPKINYFAILTFTIAISLRYFNKQNNIIKWHFERFFKKYFTRYPAVGAIYSIFHFK
jgi:hypothetical protein